MTFSDFLTMPIPDGREGKMLEIYFTKEIKESAMDDIFHDMKLSDPVARCKCKWAQYILSSDMFDLAVVQVQGSVDPNVLKLWLSIPDEDDNP